MKWHTVVRTKGRRLEFARRGLVCILRERVKVEAPGEKPRWDVQEVEFSAEELGGVLRRMQEVDARS